MVQLFRELLKSGKFLSAISESSESSDSSEIYIIKDNKSHKSLSLQYTAVLTTAQDKTRVVMIPAIIKASAVFL
jgi:hypothetical protein